MPFGALASGMASEASCRLLSRFSREAHVKWSWSSPSAHRQAAVDTREPSLWPSCRATNSLGSGRSRWHTRSCSLARRRALRARRALFRPRSRVTHTIRAKDPNPSTRPRRDILARGPREAQLFTEPVLTGCLGSPLLSEVVVRASAPYATAATLPAAAPAPPSHRPSWAACRWSEHQRVRPPFLSSSAVISLTPPGSTLPASPAAMASMAPASTGDWSISWMVTLRSMPRTRWMK
jgi:hypothetical protein